jgi:uncharacterized membrane protein
MDYHTGVIRPAEDLRAGWRLVRDRYWPFLGIVVVGLVIGSFAPLGLLMGPMVCGIYACLLGRMRGDEPSLAVLFGGLRHFVQSFVATLIQIVPIMAMTVPVNVFLALIFLKRMMVSLPAPYPQLAAAIGPWETAAIVGAATLVIFLLSVFFGTFFMFSYPLIVDRGMTGWSAVKLSARASRDNFAGAALLMAATTIVSVVGSLVCYVGGFLVTPVTLAAWAVAYRNVFPEGEEP